MKSCNLTKNKFYTDYIKEYTNYKKLCKYNVEAIKRKYKHNGK